MQKTFKPDYIKDNFFKGKKVLITGHTGFKGAWLCLLLHHLGAKVFGYALDPPTTPSLYKLIMADEFVESCIADIRDFVQLKGFISCTQPEIIIHLAAQSLVRASYNDPRFTYETNVIGTVNLLEATRLIGKTKAILNVTTDKCYENKEWEWGYRESDSLGGIDPYSNSKACSELITASYRNSFFRLPENGEIRTSLATARSGNVIGGGDWSQDRLVPDFMRSIQAEEEVIIRNPEATRPWQFILDSLNGYLILLEKLYNEGASYAESWNFGPNDSGNKNVAGILDQLCHNWGENVGYKIKEIEQVHEAQFLKLDSSKAKNRLNWANIYSLEEGLAQTVAWYKGYYKGEAARNLCELQIKQFLKNIN